jgi:hypothetical protein
VAIGSLFASSIWDQYPKYTQYPISNTLIPSLGPHLTVEKKFKIKSVSEEAVGVGKDKENKLVLWFTNDKRGLVMNKTNIRTLRGLINTRFYWYNCGSCYRGCCCGFGAPGAGFRIS